MKASVASAVLLAASAAAHTIFQEVYVNGVDQGHEVGLRDPSYDGPITDVTSTDIICNGGPNPIVSYSPVVIQVPAGAQLTAEWHHTLAGADPSDNADPIDPGHKGPVISYLAQIADPLSKTVTGLKWFKIWQDGFQPADQSWGVDRLYAAKGKVTFTIPPCIASGTYLLRHEIIALHPASSYPGAQFYMECAQLNITGGTGAQSPPTVSFPGAYAGTDPGIKINIYQHLNNYTVPGPPVFSCSGSGSGSPSTTTSTSTSSTTTTTTTTSTSSSKSSSTTSTSSSTSSAPVTTGAAHYAQCGGQGWTGPTTCVSPWKCTVSSQYYSQCL